LVERVAEHETDILDDVVRIDLDIAARVELEVVQPVTRNRLEHVGEERHLRVDLVPSGAVQTELQPDGRFRGAPLDPAATHPKNVGKYASERNAKRQPLSFPDGFSAVARPPEPGSTTGWVSPARESQPNTSSRR